MQISEISRLKRSFVVAAGELDFADTRQKLAHCLQEQDRVWRDLRQIAGAFCQENAELIKLANHALEILHDNNFPDGLRVGTLVTFNMQAGILLCGLCPDRGRLTCDGSAVCDNPAKGASDAARDHREPDKRERTKGWPIS
jgi:hypothetical protein